MSLEFWRFLEMFHLHHQKSSSNCPFFPWKRTVEGFWHSWGVAMLHMKASDVPSKRETESCPVITLFHLQPNFQIKPKINKGKLSNSIKKIKINKNKHIWKKRCDQCLHSGRCCASSLHQLHERRLPLGSLGRAAGWLMKRKQRVKRFRELPGRCVSRVQDWKRRLTLMHQRWNDREAKLVC